MRYSLGSAALVAGLTLSGVCATPTRRHVHHSHHQKKDVDWDSLDWENMGIDWAAAYSKGMAEQAAKETPAPAPAAPAIAAEVTPSAAPAPPSPPNIIESLWNNLVGMANGATSFGQEVAPSGNTGDFYMGNYGSPYGHNMMKVASRAGFAYTNEFINTSPHPMTVVIWNKVGPDGRALSGSALAPKQTALTFYLAVGASQIIAFQENSQVAWSEGISVYAASGAFATTWGEANFVKTGSGYDVSAIMNAKGNRYKMSISSVEAPQCVSDQTQNFWLTDKQPIGDSNGSCYIAQNHATLTTKMGGEF